MKATKNSEKISLSNTIFIIFILWILYNLILFPKTSINGALKGLNLWFNVLIPSLFPFLIISEILVSLGFVEFMGDILGPIMKPLFNVSGKGAFPFTMSITSGYPVGTKIVSNMRKKQIISKIESQRLISFSSTSGPLFMIGAVSIGMLNSPQIGPLIVASHYLGTITVGLIFRFYKHNISFKYTDQKHNVFISAKNFLLFKNKNSKNLGTILSNSTKESINSILLIGGFVIFYSVLTEILYESKLFYLTLKIFHKIIPFNISTNLLRGIASGIIEITVGCKTIAESNGIPLIQKLTSISFLIGWSGLSIHSQALNFISSTDINQKLYIFAKFLHGIFSGLFCYIIYNLKYKDMAITSFSVENYPWEVFSPANWTKILFSSIQLELIVIISLTIFSIISAIIGCHKNTI
ncbi:MAG: sporulation integral membrane protein YlbJ [Tissierellaceae bacterium]|jgi:sporulation integral membrane protein YlbJ|nr:sporulation integral membrane protein YlbJ [Tissierellaceae bacterium]